LNALNTLNKLNDPEHLNIEQFVGRQRKYRRRRTLTESRTGDR